ncbi:MAG TPA: DUF167 domain-containing protein [Methylomirabilota bacterium]|jgi:uncharacterized protein (TIGR00251 family)
MSRPEAHLTVEVRPRSGRDEIVGWQGRHLRVRVAAPPADGAANEAVRGLLAERLGAARSRVEIVRGHASRTKVVRVVGLAPVELAARLAMPGGALPVRPAARPI